MRLLYMNDAAIQVWKEMGKARKIIGAQVSLPHSALLALGIPFAGDGVFESRALPAAYMCNP